MKHLLTSRKNKGLLLLALCTFLLFFGFQNCGSYRVSFESLDQVKKMDNLVPDEDLLDSGSGSSGSEVINRDENNLEHENGSHDSVVDSDSDDYVEGEVEANPEVELTDCQNNPRKALICHFPTNRADRPSTLCISRNALSHHLGRHGDEQHFDFLGPCQ